MPEQSVKVADSLAAGAASLLVNPSDCSVGYAQVNMGTATLVEIQGVIGSDNPQESEWTTFQRIVSSGIYPLNYLPSVIRFRATGGTTGRLALQMSSDTSMVPSNVTSTTSDSQVAAIQAASDSAVATANDTKLKALLTLRPSQSPWNTPTDGVTDATAGLKAFFAYLNNTANNLALYSVQLDPNVTYVVSRGSTTYQFELRRGGFTLDGMGATIRAAAGGAVEGTNTANYCLCIYGTQAAPVRDLTVRNLTLDGNRTNRPAPTTGSLNHYGIYVGDWASPRIENVTATRWVVDGFYIRAQEYSGTPANTNHYPSPTFANCRATYNGRNGMSPISSKGLTIRGGEYSYNGMLPDGVTRDGLPGGPFSGIGFEPNTSDTRDVFGNADFVVEDLVRCVGNAGEGFAATQSPNSGTIRSLLLDSNGGGSMTIQVSGNIDADTIYVRNVTSYTQANPQNAGTDRPAAVTFISTTGTARFRCRNLVAENVNGGRPLIKTLYNVSAPGYIRFDSITGSAQRGLDAFRPIQIKGMDLTVTDWGLSFDATANGSSIANATIRGGTSFAIYSDATLWMHDVGVFNNNGGTYAVSLAGGSEIDALRVIHTAPPAGQVAVTMVAAPLAERGIRTSGYAVGKKVKVAGADYTSAN